MGTSAVETSMAIQLRHMHRDRDRNRHRRADVKNWAGVQLQVQGSSYRYPVTMHEYYEFEA